MGMFDSIWFKCKKCEAPIEDQSKVGECLLINYDATSVPESIAKSIQGDELWCQKCHAKYIVDGEDEKRVSVTLRED